MSYVELIKTSELDNNEMKKVTIDNEVILVVKLDDEFFALSNRCPHMGGSLGDGVLEKGIIRCPRHKAGFDVKTGECVINPKILFVQVKANDAITYPVEIKEDSVRVNIT